MMRGKTHLVRATKNRPLSEGNLCNYSHRTCMLNRLDGYEYCLKHILEDKSAPFKQCSFVSSRKAKRCPNAASKIDRKDSYCQEHVKKAAILRVKSGMKKRPKETSESLLEELATCNHPTASVDSTPPTKRSRLPSDSIISKVLDYATSSDSEVETPQVDQSWRGDGDSDAESIDSEQEDVLKHAGVYTAEEVALILRDKLIRLQSLYIDQFKRLQHIMKEKRRKYLHMYKHDREMFGSIKSYKKDPAQSHKYEKLKALKKYHNRCGKEALLHRQSKERRIAVSEGPNYKPPSYPKCCHIKDDSTRCSGRTVPLSKFCAKHILHDPRQVFFHPCGFAEGSCGRPVPGYVDPPFCSLHVPLYDPELRIHDLGNICSDPELLEDIKQEPDLFGRDAEVKEENESADVDVESPAISSLFVGDDVLAGMLASASEASLTSGSTSSLTSRVPSSTAGVRSLSGPSMNRSSSVGLASASLKRSVSSGVIQSASETSSTLGTASSISLLSSESSTARMSSSELLISISEASSLSDSKTKPGSLTASEKEVPTSEATPTFGRMISGTEGSAAASAEGPLTSRTSTSSTEGPVASGTPVSSSEGSTNVRSEGHASTVTSVGSSVASGMPVSRSSDVPGSSEGFMPNGDDPKELGKPSEETVCNGSEEAMDIDT